MTDDLMPVDEAARSLAWAMGQMDYYRRQRDTYRMLFEKLDAATRAYVAEVAPLHARKPTDAANAERTRISDEHAARARLYLSSGLSYQQIGVRMAADDDRPDDPYSRETVRRWLRRPPKASP